MSETFTTPNPTDEQSEGFDFNALTDVRIENDVRATWQTYRAEAGTLAKSAASATNRLTNVKKALAEKLVQIRALMIRPDGFPDWAANSDAYKVAVMGTITPNLSTLGADEQSRLMQAVRQHVRRNALLPGIVGFILSHGADAALAAEAALWAGSQEDRDKVLTSPSQPLIREVRKHYASAGKDSKNRPNLTVPDGPFAESHTAATPPVIEAAPANPLEKLDDALGGLLQITPEPSVLGLLRTITALSAQLTDPKMGAIENRTKVINALERIGTIGTLTALTLSGTDKDHEGTVKALTAAYATAADVLS